MGNQKIKIPGSCKPCVEKDTTVEHINLDNVDAPLSMD